MAINFRSNTIIKNLRVGPLSGGAVYVYDVNNLSNAPTKLTASDGGVWLSFGGSVSLG